MKKRYLAALVSFALIPVVMMAVGGLFAAIDPESAAGHGDYERNYRLLEGLRQAIMFAGFLLSLALWLASCCLLLTAKRRSYLWISLAMLGPVGLAALTMLNDGEPHPADVLHAFRAKLGPALRAVYEVILFMGIWILAFAGVALKEEWTAILEASRRGVTVSQILQERDASSGMMAFGEGLEIMYLVVLLYLMWPVAVNAACGLWRRFGRRAATRGMLDE